MRNTKPLFKTGIGQDSHKFDPQNTQKSLWLGGLKIVGHPPLLGNSDADVILHALTNAVSGITCQPILGKTADEMCQQGIVDSRFYLERALEDLKNLLGFELCHVSVSVECLVPKLEPIIPTMRSNIAAILNLNVGQVAITATTGEGLTSFGRGEGIQALAVVSAICYSV